MAKTKKITCKLFTSAFTVGSYVHMYRIRVQLLAAPRKGFYLATFFSI